MTIKFSKQHGHSSLKCLLVKGWKAEASWSILCGKWNKDEEDHASAIREVNLCLYHVPEFIFLSECMLQFI